uniref:Methyltransferase type 11 domain-containing protein n=1 Tax=Zea mays TaxID=4577 RepID=A0A804LWV1_MAIZE
TPHSGISSQCAHVTTNCVPCRGGPGHVRRTGHTCSLRPALLTALIPLRRFAASGFLSAPPVSRDAPPLPSPNLPWRRWARRSPPQQLPRRRAAIIGIRGATSRRAVTGLPPRGGLTCAPAPHLPSPLPTYQTRRWWNPWWRRRRRRSSGSWRVQSATTPWRARAISWSSQIDGCLFISSDATSLECPTCKKCYPNKQDYWDLTVSVGSTEYSESMPVATELFRTPLVSFLYERGWRQNFIWGGFPGLEREFEMAKTYLKPTIGGTIVDASCGSGLFSRLFIKSGLYSLVVALDFSENMLKQCNQYIKQENISDERLVLVRADISRLPFVSGSIDALHAGAAIHCWPSPACAVADISRVLRPGGIFVASTFVADVIPPAIPVLKIVRPYISQITGNNTFLSEVELEDLCKACGLVDFKFVRSGFYIMFSATKAC